MLDFSNVFHQFSLWLFRLAVAAAAVGVVYLYLNRPASVPGAVPPCQPIGHTASDELVYSMDCEQLPAADAASGGTDK